MKPSGTFVAVVLFASSAIGAAPAYAGGPPNDGGGGGGAPAAASGSCTGLSVTSGPVEPANTLRHVVVTFTNTSSAVCTLVGYPDANLVTAAGGVLVHVEPQQALASHLLHLNPGASATAAVQSSALDVNGSGNPCPREGTLVVTAPGDSVAHTLPVALPICHATISNVD